MNTTKPLIKWGWLRVLIYFIIIMATGYGMQFLNEPVGAFMKQNASKSLAEFFTFAATYSATGVLFVGITFLFTTLLGGQSIASIGFTIKGYRNEAAIGFFAPLFLLGSGTLALIFTGHLSIGGLAFNPLLFFLQLLLMVVVAFVEEIMFRGYLLNNLMQSMNKWVALLISASLFALVHLDNPDVTWVSFANILLAGLVLGINYAYTKNLWYSIVFHFMWNFFQGPVLGYDVSGYKLQSVFIQTLSGSNLYTGGLFGFEGSIICAILLLISLIVLYNVFSKRYDIVKQQA